jgi:uncharacterized membrane protein YqgA involved in biofilm formation
MAHGGAVLGTLLNVGTVLTGGVIGTVVGSRFPAGLRLTLMQAIGLATIAIGIQSALATSSILLLLASLVLGSILGELMRIESGLDRVGELAQRGVTHWDRRTRPNPLPEVEGARHPPLVPFATRDPRPVSPAQAFVTASLIFCVGPMTILGSFEEGLTGTFHTLALKATLDGFTAAILASTLGWGVLLAAGTVLLYQGALTLGAGLLRGVLTNLMISEMAAVGGLLIVGIGLNILELSRIRVANMLPSLAVAPALVAVQRMA